MHKKKDIIALGGGVLTTRPPGGLSPNQAQAASPMVCGWRLCAWFGCRRAIGDGRGQSRRRNEFQVLTQALKNSLLQHVEVRYSSTYVEEEKKRRVRTRVKPKRNTSIDCVEDANKSIAIGRVVAMSLIYTSQTSRHNVSGILARFVPFGILCLLQFGR